MSGWSIQIDAVSGVLTTVLGHLGDEDATEGLSGSIQTMDTAVQSAAEECGDSFPVETALGLFMSHYGPLCGQMVRRTGSAVTACSEVDLEMAETAQRNNLEAPVTEDDLPPNLWPPPAPESPAP
ncbi:DUF6507 family protein [Nocardiopsis salina]|uniref:DUF6507 family protein n=1 Tax=Nocardiopsis salina TaxID=245836 RepID=UPI00034A0165|nr:DUF6507 family protein [Nocardiopsis salina]